MFINKHISNCRKQQSKFFFRNLKGIKDFSKKTSKHKHNNLSINLKKADRKKLSFSYNLDPVKSQLENTARSSSRPLIISC